MADYDRKILVTTLIYHWRTKANRCECGWGSLGASFPEHVADEYEKAVILGLPHDWRPTTPTQAVSICRRCGHTAFGPHVPERGCVVLS